MYAGAAWTAYVPAAARWPVELHLVPHRVVPDLAALDSTELAELANLYPALPRRRFGTMAYCGCGRSIGVPSPGTHAGGGGSRPSGGLGGLSTPRTSRYATILRYRIQSWIARLMPPVPVAAWMTGAGFGGPALVLVERRATTTVAHAVKTAAAQHGHPAPTVLVSG